MALIDSKKHQLTIQRKLLLGVVLMALFVGVLLSVAKQIAQQSTQQQQEIQNQAVKPLVQVNSLQSLIYRIRVTEVNLHVESDFFALTAASEKLSADIQLFERNWRAFIDEFGEGHDRQIRSIDDNWQRLQSTLNQVIQFAVDGKIADAFRLSQFESQPRFNVIAKELEILVTQIEISTDGFISEAVAELEAQQQRFLMISFVGMLVAIILMILFSRYLVLRLNRMREAFSIIANGDLEHKVDVVGHDELTALARSFNAMQEKLADRQTALTQARLFLEERVTERTKELNESNLRLREEVVERAKIQQEIKILSLAVSQTPVSIIITDARGMIEYVNGAVVQASGFDEVDLLGKSAISLINKLQTPEASFNDFSRAINGDKEWVGELCSMSQSGDSCWEAVHLSPVATSAADITHYLIIKEDITERREQEQRLLYQASYDALTELPNRTLGMDRLAQGVSNARRLQHKLAVMFIDLDGFKNVNDSLGHDIGDQLLIMAASRLLNTVRESDVVARLGGDEFLIIMPAISEQADCFPVLDKIKHNFSETFELAGHSLAVTPSIGLSIFPEDGEDGAILLRNADLAMYQAKEAGRNTYRFFNHQIHENLTMRMQVETQLKSALDDQEFSLFYQPIVEAQTKKLVGVEALLRWNNSLLGPVSPDQFIGIAEQTGLIVPIGNWVLKTACMQIAEWRDHGLYDLSLAINVSPRQLHGEGLGAVIAQTLDDANLNPENLILEVTEGLLIRNPAEAKRTLEALKELGIGVAMDDFGTGYSSLSNLKNYPFDILKVDRTFVRDIASDPEDCALVSAAISMSSGLGLPVVAEGVETEQQLNILADMNCDRVQGYFFSKPLAPEDFLLWVKGYQGSEISSTNE
ncbi:EAL domain-containing protein [Neptuniibacter sp. SY11_33]|uniref:bifunctional diguanylate cyclase/phosphodiesterase n=1 Tax=Neptuniibacter sp. SY11_33 TaxID=3398215 RepID=UPI0039F53A69